MHSHVTHLHTLAPLALSCSASSSLCIIARHTRDVTHHWQVKARVPRAEKKADEWRVAGGGGGSSSSAPAKPDLDDDELQVLRFVTVETLDAWRVGIVHPRNLPLLSDYAIFVRACESSACPQHPFARCLHVTFCTSHMRTVMQRYCVPVVIVFRRELVANLGGATGSGARRPQLQ